MLLARVTGHIKNIKNIKVELSNPEEVIQVLRGKAQLGSVQAKDIRGVWIRKSKTRRQLIQDHNNSVMLRAMRLQNKYRQDAQGRIVPLVNQNQNQSPPENGPEDVNTHSRAIPAQSARSDGAVRGRGGRKNQGHRRDRPYRRPQKERGPPLQISDELITALSLPTNHNGGEIENNVEMEERPANE